MDLPDAGVVSVADDAPGSVVRLGPCRVGEVGGGVDFRGSSYSGSRFSSAVNVTPFRPARRPCAAVRSGICQGTVASTWLGGGVPLGAPRPGSPVSAVDQRLSSRIGP